MWEADDSQDLWATPGNSPAASMAHGERMVGSELTPEDLDVDRTLRPQRLDDYCGQEHIKQSLRVLIEAAQSRGETLDHVIFSGPPGLGKTTLATVIANELGAQIKTTSGPAIARTGDLAAILTNLQPGDVLFIDEIHRLNRSVEEVLYPAMEDFALDIVIGKGPAARSIRLDIPKFTLVAATTRSGMLTGPLRDRFGISYRLDYYTVEELAQIVTRSATILGVTIDHGRVFGLDTTLSTLGMPLGMLIFAPLADVIPISLVFIIGGVLTLPIGIYLFGQARRNVSAQVTRTAA